MKRVKERKRPMAKKKAKKRSSAKKLTRKKMDRKKPAKKKKVAKKRPKAKPAPKRQPTEEERKQLNKEKTRARDYIADKEKTAQLLEEAVKKAKQNKGALKKVWDRLLTLLRLVRAWVKGEYREVPLNTILLSIAAIIYFVNPFDVIPDFIPGVGYIDDAAVIAFVINSIRTDLADFLNWERSKK